MFKKPDKSGTGQPAQPTQIGKIDSQQVTPGRRWQSLADAHTRRAAPASSPITFGQQPSIEEPGGDPPKTTRTYLPREGPSTMSPHNDRCTSKATVSPDQGQPDTAIATFSSGRPVIQSSTGSIRRVRRAHHRPEPAKIICNREEQNHPLTDGVKGISGHSRPSDTASSWHYWGRRRHGPVQ
jgi:hypothetical protein